MKTPVIDLHCDLLSYLTMTGTTINDVDEIGCAAPHLKNGNVKVQVMAIFAPVEEKSHDFGLQQAQIFKDISEAKNPLYQFEAKHLAGLESNDQVGMLAAIESASAFCDEQITLEEGFKNLESIIEKVGRVLYISLTHHAENRFGGGNYTSVGLKKDGEALLEFMSGRNIALDFSHTSDALAEGMLNYISAKNLDIPLLASHSNYRSVFDHPRNLTDEVAREIIAQGGLIGVNFLRAFMHLTDPEVLVKHMEHGLKLGGEATVSYGADYFYTKNNPDQSRVPFYFPEHADARSYGPLNEKVATQFGQEQMERISFGNAKGFLKICIG